MHDLNDHNRTKDPFSDYFRQQLDEHTLPVDRESWELIDATLKRHTLRKRLITAALLAAALFTGLFFVIPTLDAPQPEELAEQVTTVGEEPARQSVIAPEEELSLSKESSRAEQPVASPLLARMEPVDEVVSVVEPSHAMLPQREQAVSEPVEEMKQEESPSSESLPINKGGMMPPEERNYSHRQQRNPFTPKKKSPSSDWHLAARVGSSSGASVNLSMGDYADADPPQHSNDGGNYGNFMMVNRPAYLSPDQLDQKQVATMDHNIPLSFGLLVRKQVTPLFAIESGLQYTFLSSRLTYSNYLYRRGDRKLHYLGIPVNVVATVVNKNRWELYLSGGGLLEKGLREINTYHTINQLHEQTFTEKRSIDGLQWSLHLSVGASYRLFDRTSLYVEPLLSYHFDNDQPESYRTDNKLTVGVAAGLRFAF
ncbi:PorT family protein [Parabacteroides sp. OttesenSCG-928-N08]|nr:PorT family protein [Parabacteroides sp. OttesenSCG-928-N08]